MLAIRQDKKQHFMTIFICTNNITHLLMHIQTELELRNGLKK